ncbi:MAG: hypothetical protein M1816_001232 [Peltula sp. TS41687]|nr:MAG: hypothetical protein M1816_001232 [Peltula sp. TS41687]
MPSSTRKPSSSRRTKKTTSSSSSTTTTTSITNMSSSPNSLATPIAIRSPTSTSSRSSTSSTSSYYSLRRPSSSGASRSCAFPCWPDRESLQVYTRPEDVAATSYLSDDDLFLDVADPAFTNDATVDQPLEVIVSVRRTERGFLRRDALPVLVVDGDAMRHRAQKLVGIARERKDPRDVMPMRRSSPARGGST